MSDKKQPSATIGKSLFSIGGLVLILVALVLINVIISKINLRWDTTEDNLYSLSDGTRQILADLKQDTILKFFYTRDLENVPVHIQNYARRVQDFLSEYENAGGGRITVETYNPEPDSEEEEWAVKYGLEGAALPTGERVFFGLVVLAADQEETIPMFDPAREEQLEYDITRLIARVQSADKSKISVISGLPVFGGPGMPMQGGPAQPWLFIEELKKSYDVKEVAPTEESFDADTDLLMIIAPKTMSERLQFAVDQFVLNGGNVLVFADPAAISDTSRTPPGEFPMKALFTAWGIEMDTTRAVIDYDYATRLRMGNNQVENNPAWLSVPAGAFNKDAIVTAQLESMLLPIAGALKKAASSPYEYERLFGTSANSALTDAMRLRFGGGGDMLRKDFAATPDTYDLAVKIRGTFKTAFPAGKPAGQETEATGEDKGDPLKEGKAAATIIVVGDADMLFDNYYVSRQNFLGFNISRMFNDNLNFLLNSAEMLTGSDALISIRSRGKFERPFTRVKELEKKAQDRWLAQEQELMRKADETNQKLRQFEQQKDASQQFILSEAQEAEIHKFQEEKSRINRELKEVRRNLRADIESLGAMVKFINIFLMVILVGLSGAIYAIYRRNKGAGLNQS